MSVRLQTPNISQAGTWPCQECHLHGLDPDSVCINPAVPGTPRGLSRLPVTSATVP